MQDILTASMKIEAITAGTTEERFLTDEVLPAAVLHHLAVIGEAISRLSPELRRRHPKCLGNKSWPCAIGSCMPTSISTGKILWNASTDDIPQLREQVGRILESEFPESRSD